jgi:methylenetetrahydrofolate reductase (NADPH)
MMFTWPYLIEILTPARSPEDKVASLLDRFSERCRRVIDSGCGISIPDNPMGRPRYSAFECFEATGYWPAPEKIVLNLNTFHSKDELDAILRRAAEFGVRNLLVVRGDGGPKLPRLDPLSVGGTYNIATTMDLLRYIKGEYGDQFATGAAFNPYKPMPFELDRAREKLEAGAEFMITQPLIGKNEDVDSLRRICDDVIVEAWMSTKIELFYKSVGRMTMEEPSSYDPVKNLSELHNAYPDSCVYLSMISFDQDWQLLLPKLASG